MKVTVCFGIVKVMVPCGEGTLSVGELIEKSVQRYKKATGRNPEYWVHVHSLASQSEGGILDVDDIVCDVADDREKLTAHFEEQDPTRSQTLTSNHFVGDGTSTCASSVGTASPVNFSDMTHINNSNNKTHHMHNLQHHHHHANNNGVLEEEDNEMDIVVTGEESDSKLVVRRGSDPVITMSSKPEVNGENGVMDKNANTLPAKTNSSDKPRSRRGSRDELSSAFSRFGRDSARQSLSSAHPNVNKWTDAQQKAENTQNTSERGPDVMTEDDQDLSLDSIVLTNDGTPLGVHIISKIEQEDGSVFGIVVHSIEPGGRAARDGRLKPGDYIVQINGSDISLHSFNRAQEMLREAMRNPTVKLTVQREKHLNPDEAVIAATVLTTSAAAPRQNGHLEITIPPKSPGGGSKVPPVIPVRSPTTSLSSPVGGPGDKNGGGKVISPGPTSTRRIGRKLYIQLMKGPQGLGFSVTSRDNPTGGKNPIFIKNIMSKGAALSDGRLKPGDRLMEVNGIEMTGKSQTEAVSILRSVKLGGVVNLVVSRQDSPVKMVPRQMPEDTAVDDPTVAHNRAVMTFDIPLNDTGSAGLGVSVKGKTSGATEDQPSKDLGIFIKSVIHGGAASKDGRLRPNDQLLCINDTSLANMSNSEAMETLRLAMSHEKSPRSTISLVIARRLDQEPPNLTNGKSGSSSSAADRNVDSGLTSPFPQDEKFGNAFAMPSSKSDGILSMRASRGSSPHGNEIVVQAAVEPQHATMRGQGAKVMYPGNDVELVYSSKMRKSSSGQTLPGGESAMMVDTQANYSHPPTSPGVPHPSTHSSPSARAPSPPQWLLDWEPQDGELSPPADADKYFDRDNYARASFSERRQGGSLDAKQMAWYKKTKGERTDQTPNKQASQKDVAASTSSLLRASSMDSLLDSKPSTSQIEDKQIEIEEEEKQEGSKPMGPGLGMEKSSSLESLQAAVADVNHQREDFPGRPRPKVRRGRVCNDSFRAAVDRSYQDANGDTIPAMSTVMEAEESGISRIPSSGSGDGGVMTAGSMKKKTKKEEKDAKTKAKGSGTGFKGLFRFGKNRKSIGSENALKNKDKDGKNQEREVDRTEQEELERKKARQQAKQEKEKKKARQQAKQEKEKIDEEIQRMREQQQAASSSSTSRTKEESQEALSKADRMMQLRQQFQQRHRDGQGRYVDDMEEDEEEYSRVDPRDANETLSQRERLEAARAEQKEKERQTGKTSERSGTSDYNRCPPEAEDRRKDWRDDPYAESRDRREDRMSNNRYADDPYADPRNLRNNRYNDDKYGRRNDREHDDNPYEKYDVKKESVQDGRAEKRDDREFDSNRQEKRRSLKRTDRIDQTKYKEDKGRDYPEERREVERAGEERERRTSDRRSDRSTERRNPKRDDPRFRDDRYERKDVRPDRRDERYHDREMDDGRRDGGRENRENRHDGRKEERMYERGGGDGDRWTTARDDRPDRYADQRDRYRAVQQQGDRHSYGSLDRPSRRPRGKDPAHKSMSEDRAESEYGRTQDYPRYNNTYNDHQQPSRRPPYSNGPVPSHAPPQGRDRYQRSKSSSDYLDYREEPRRSRSTADQLEDEYYAGSRRSAPSQAKKGHLREVNDGRMYNDSAARV